MWNSVPRVLYWVDAEGCKAAWGVVPPPHPAQNRPSPSCTHFIILNSWLLSSHSKDAVSLDTGEMSITKLHSLHAAHIILENTFAKQMQKEDKGRLCNRKSWKCHNKGSLTHTECQECSRCCARRVAVERKRDESCSNRLVYTRVALYAIWGFEDSRTLY